MKSFSEETISLASHITTNQTIPTYEVLTSDPQTWKNSNLLSVSQIDPDGLRLLYSIAISMRELVKVSGGDDRLKHKILANIFYEPSTRTDCSFRAAMLRLGGSVIHIDASSKGGSSSNKGESLADSIRCIESYSNVIVLRHPVKGSVKMAARGRFRPLINAGDGTGEHPTQALLDLFTIVDELGFLNNMFGHGNYLKKKELLIVVFLGDLKHGRAVHSLVKLLASSANIFLGKKLVLRYCSPEGVEIPKEIINYVERECMGNEVVQETVKKLEEAVRNANVLYVTRIQKERFEKQEAWEVVKSSYVVDATLLSKSPSDMIVMHPLPRLDEISVEVDLDERSAYFRQMENGMYVRMAILSLILANS